jgi:hypothetical protein
MQGNLLSTAVFVLWVPLMLWGMYRLRRRPAFSTMVVLLGAVMFLPEVVSFKVPGLPPFNKEGIAVVWTVVAVLLWHRSRLRNLSIGWPIWILFLLLPIGAVGTASTNRDPQVFGPTVLPGLQDWDAVHFLADDTLKYVVPFLLGAAMVRTRRDLREVLAAIVLAGLVYAPFILFEARMSPQLHNWPYGFPQRIVWRKMCWGNP